MPPAIPLCAGIDHVHVVFQRHSKQRHTAHQHPIEGRNFTIRFIPVRRDRAHCQAYAYRGAELVVIPAARRVGRCIPAWMTHESAAHHQFVPTASVA